jgi:hypothetical protein
MCRLADDKRSLPPWCDWWFYCLASIVKMFFSVYDLLRKVVRVGYSIPTGSRRTA